MIIKNILDESLQKRSIFHSEADFQHHLAWEIHNTCKDKNIRLEFPLSKDNSKKWEYCDILINSSPKIGIELKYKTKLLIETIKEETFELKQQDAQDLGRYDFIKDILRLEHWCHQKKIKIGYAIILTNDKSYWLESRNKNTVDKSFRIHPREIEGKLSWDNNASKGTTKGRESEIELTNKYSLQWCDTPREDFKYLIIEIKC